MKYIYWKEDTITLQMISLENSESTEKQLM